MSYFSMIPFAGPSSKRGASDIVSNPQWSSHSPHYAPAPNSSKMIAQFLCPKCATLMFKPKLGLCGCSRCCSCTMCEHGTSTWIDNKALEQIIQTSHPVEYEDMMIFHLFKTSGLNSTVKDVARIMMASSSIKDVSDRLQDKYPMNIVINTNPSEMFYPPEGCVVSYTAPPYYHKPVTAIVVRSKTQREEDKSDDENDEDDVTEKGTDQDETMTIERPAAPVETERKEPTQAVDISLDELSQSQPASPPRSNVIDQPTRENALDWINCHAPDHWTRQLPCIRETQWHPDVVRWLALPYALPQKNKRSDPAPEEYTRKRTYLRRRFRRIRRNRKPQPPVAFNLDAAWNAYQKALNFVQNTPFSYTNCLELLAMLSEISRYCNDWWFPELAAWNGLPSHHPPSSYRQPRSRPQSDQAPAVESLLQLAGSAQFDPALMAQPSIPPMGASLMPLVSSSTVPSNPVSINPAPVNPAPVNPAPVNPVPIPPQVVAPPSPSKSQPYNSPSCSPLLTVIPKKFKRLVPVNDD